MSSPGASNRGAGPRRAWALAVSALSLRSRLAVFALVCTVPVLTLLVVQRASDAEDLRVRAGLEAEVRTANLAREIGHTIAGVESGLLAVGALELTPANRDACNAALERAVAAAPPHVLNYSALDRAGQIVCSGRPVPPSPGGYADRTYFQRVLATRQPFLSGFLRGRVTNQGTLQLAVPHLDPQGQLTAVAVAALRSDSFTAGTAQEPGVVVLLLDRDGLVVSRDPPGPAPGTSARGQPLEQAIGRTLPPTSLRGLDGVQRIYSVRPVRYRGDVVLTVLVGIDASLAEAKLAATRNRQVAIVLLVELLVLVAALLLGRPMVLGRVSGLLRAANAVRHGDGSVRVPVHARDELAQVETTFNRMLDAIERDRRALVSSERRYRLLVEQGLDGVLQVAAGGRIVAANQAAAGLLERSPAELAQLRWQDLGDATDERFARFDPVRVDRVEGAELRLLRPDGSPVECEVAAVALEADEGESFACIVLRDRTVRLQQEQAAADAQRKLEVRVRLRTQELEAMNQRLEAFTYTVSHDLRSPIATISGFAGALRERDNLADERSRHYLDRIGAAAHHAHELIEGLLALAQIAREPLRLERVDVTALALEAVAQCRATDPGRACDVEVAPGLVLHGDRRLLRALLSNLVNNAWKFTGPVDTPRIEVGWTTHPDAGGLDCIVVRDNGVGFDPAQAHRLFRAFQRLHARDEFPGSGIGLATVMEVVRRHRGEIRTDATPGAGAAFTFWFPEPAPDSA